MNKERLIELCVKKWPSYISIITKALENNIIEILLIDPQTSTVSIINMYEDNHVSRRKISVNLF